MKALGRITVSAKHGQAQQTYIAIGVAAHRVVDKLCETVVRVHMRDNIVRHACQLSYCSIHWTLCQYPHCALLASRLMVMEDLPTGPSRMSEMPSLHVHIFIGHA